MGPVGENCGSEGFRGMGIKKHFFILQIPCSKVLWRLINSSSLWTRVVQHKYIAPLSILEWIRNPIKSMSGISIIWKAVIKAFDLIGMVWSGGLAQEIWSGLAWTCGLVAIGHIYLMLEYAHSWSVGVIYYLAQVGDPTTSNIWQQGWKNGQMLGLTGDEQTQWDRYIWALRRANICLTDREDELLWDGDPGGVYTPKEGYVQLSVDLHQRETIWWWKKLWKQRCPAKGKIWFGQFGE
jgi:hypothetical protein